VFGTSRNLNWVDRQGLAAEQKEIKTYWSRNNHFSIFVSRTWRFWKFPWSSKTQKKSWGENWASFFFTLIILRWGKKRMTNFCHQIFFIPRNFFLVFLFCHRSSFFSPKSTQENRLVNSVIFGFASKTRKEKC